MKNKIILVLVLISFVGLPILYAIRPLGNTLVDPITQIKADIAELQLSLPKQIDPFRVLTDAEIIDHSIVYSYEIETDTASLKRLEKTLNQKDYFMICSQGAILILQAGQYDFRTKYRPKDSDEFELELNFDLKECEVTRIGVGSYSRTINTNKFESADIAYLKAFLPIESVNGWVLQDISANHTTFKVQMTAVEILENTASLGQDVLEVFCEDGKFITHTNVLIIPDDLKDPFVKFQVNQNACETKVAKYSNDVSNYWSSR